MSDAEIAEKLKAGYPSRKIDGIKDYDQEEVIQFLIGFHEGRRDVLIAALTGLLEVFDDNSGKIWTTSSRRRALDAAREAIKLAMGDKE